MWSKEKSSPASCSECHARLPAQAEACSECGYPVTGSKETTPPDGVSRTALREYKLLQLLGGSLVAVGIIAAIADSPVAATVAIAVGTATYMTGLLGSWWNNGD